MAIGQRVYTKWLTAGAPTNLVPSGSLVCGVFVNNGSAISVSVSGVPLDPTVALTDANGVNVSARFGALLAASGTYNDQNEWAAPGGLAFTTSAGAPYASKVEVRVNVKGH